MFNKEKAKSYLEVITSIAVLIVSAVVLATFALNYYRARWPPTQLQAGLQKGVALPPLQALNYSDSPQTLLVALNTRCEYCTASVPFYNQLAELQRNNNKGIKIVALFPNPADEVSQYVAQKKLELIAIAAPDVGGLGLYGTPTMILVDNQGRVIDFWIGKLSPNVEQEVIGRLSNNGPTG